MRRGRGGGGEQGERGLWVWRRGGRLRKAPLVQSSLSIASASTFCDAFSLSLFLLNQFQAAKSKLSHFSLHRAGWWLRSNPSLPATRYRSPGRRRAIARRRGGDAARRRRRCCPEETQNPPSARRTARRAQTAARSRWETPSKWESERLPCVFSEWGEKTDNDK